MKLPIEKSKGPWKKGKHLPQTAEEMGEQIMQEGSEEAVATDQNQKEIDSLRGQIDYAKQALSSPDTEEWERKEFQGVMNDANAKLQKLIKNS